VIESNWIELITIQIKLKFTTNPVQVKALVSADAVESCKRNTPLTRVDRNKYSPNA